MNIEEFFELSTGKWFAHRTSHVVAAKQMQEAKSEIIFEKIPATNPEITRICESCKINANSQIIAVKVNWNDTTKLNQKNTGSVILALVADASNANEGKLFRQVSNTEKPLTGYYKLGADESLTLVIESENTTSEEKLWFASDNLRMRVSSITHSGILNTSSFTTEIRMGVSPAKTSEAANSTSN
ncbi:phycobiliprotein lyase [Brunnivagina elsteri]|uniref:Chromophore lyase CpcS/CpeS n=1 Tax=Brunnivagina elsteri CCALA 953 TaxID=987040 RepID=A0A2A2TER1_9CYAN|nr:phycobiliprotein lyase [Calothrix elsteri]PAX52203.1 phycobiliprotein lyase [Calothrix elsteri CCALA 953]